MGFFRSALIVSMARAVNVILALALGVLSARFFGASSAKDCYLVAQNIPALLTTVLLGGLYSSTLITLSEIGASEGASAQVAFIRRLLGHLALILLPSAAIFMLTPESVVRVFAPGFDASQVDLASRLLRITTISAILGVAYIVVRCLFEARGLFTTTCLLYLIVPFLTLVALVAFGKACGVFALALGPLLGLIVAVSVLTMTAVRTLQVPPGTLSPMGTEAAAKRYRRFWVGLAPMSLAANSGQINILVDNAFSSALPAGSITMLGFALSIVWNAEFLTSLSLAEVAFPRLNAAGLRGPAELREALRVSSRFMLLLTAPLSAGVLAFGGPLARLLFERGNFTSASTLGVSRLLACFSLEIILMGYLALFSRVLFARRRLRAVVSLSIGAIISNAVLDRLLMIPFGINGIAIATTVVTFLHFLMLVPFVRRETGAIYTAEDWRFVSRLLAIAASMGVTVFFGASWFERSFDVAHEITRVFEVGLGIGVGAGVYLGLLRAFGIEEARLVLRRLNVPGTSFLYR